MCFRENECKSEGGEPEKPPVVTKDIVNEMPAVAQDKRVSVPQFREEEMSAPSVQKDEYNNQCVQKLMDLMKKRVYDGTDFGTLNDVLNAKDCPVCRMLAHCVKQYQGTEHPTTHWPDGTEIR